MIIAITNPINPIAAKPIAETIEINLNSCELGFFNKDQTLLDCAVNDLIFSNILWIRNKGF